MEQAARWANTLSRTQHGPWYVQSSNIGGSTFGFEFFQEPFSEGEEERKD